MANDITLFLSTGPNKMWTTIEFSLLTYIYVVQNPIEQIRWDPSLL